MSAPALDDVVATYADVPAGARVPLLVLEPLREFLDARGLGAGEIIATPIGDGRSNVTYLLARDDLELVLRRSPRPPLPPGAHDMAREAGLLRALEPTAARTPRLLALCEDAEVIGTPFYLMEKVDGLVVHDSVPAELDSPSQRQRMAEELIDALVELHAVDWRAAGLSGRDHGYLERQLRRFGELWEHNRTREVPAVEKIGRWLAERLPASPPATIVHGDYRLGNVIFAARRPTRLLAVLDWELATVGDPLADLGYLCALWIEREDPDRGMYELGGVTRREGFPRRAQLIDRYERLSGRVLGDVRWYEALALWKSAVIMEGNLRRALEGATDDPVLAGFGEGVLELVARAEALVDGT